MVRVGVVAHGLGEFVDAGLLTGFLGNGFVDVGCHAGENLRGGVWLREDFFRVLIVE